MNQCVIIAGGQGERMKKVLKDTPKLLMDIGDKKLIDYQIEIIKKNNIKNIHFCLGLYHKQIIEYLEKSHSEINFSYSLEEKPLGTYGALINAYDNLQEKFMVMYGDILTTINTNNYFKKFNKLKADILLVSRYTDHPSDSDIILESNNQVIDIKKGNLLPDNYMPIGNTGIMFIDKKTIEKASGEFPKDITKDYLIPNIKRYKIVHELSIDFIKDIGTPERLAKVKNLLPEIYNNKIIFIDRDDTLIENLGDSNNWQELKFIDGAIDFIKFAQEKLYKFVLITNQPGISKSFFSEDELYKTHSAIQQSLIRNKCSPLVSIHYCPHHPEKGHKNEIKELKIDCKCRKPKNGLFYEFKDKFNPIIKDYFYIGNNESDLEFGNNIKAKTFIVNNKGFKEATTFDKIKNYL
tara:strand:+ start:2552 stop:3775 length:1224 start_codon:yes stop_codon:yes gene_type:complete